MAGVGDNAAEFLTPSRKQPRSNERSRYDIVSLRLRLPHRHPYRDARSAAGKAPDVQPAAQQADALFHSGQPLSCRTSARTPGGGAIESAAVVFHADGNRVARSSSGDANAGGVGMFDHIIQALLHDPIQTDLGFGWEDGIQAFDVRFAFEAVRFGHLPHQRTQSAGEAERIELKRRNARAIVRTSSSASAVTWPISRSSLSALGPTEGPARPGPRDS